MTQSIVQRTFPGGIGCSLEYGAGGWRLVFYRDTDTGGEVAYWYGTRNACETRLCRVTAPRGLNWVPLSLTRRV
jgi:hypothetical protein